MRKQSLLFWIIAEEINSDYFSEITLIVKYLLKNLTKKTYFV
jgi:hypothetical protein